MNLDSIFKPGVITATPSDTIASVATKMQEHNVGAVVVVEKERPVGIVTDRDIALAVGANRTSIDTAIKSVMTPHVVAVPREAGIFTVTRFMKEQGVRRLPVVDRQDRVVGIVTLDDVLRCLGGELFNLAEGIKSEMSVRFHTAGEPSCGCTTH
jgi:CBS domain-containing protein